MKINELFEVSQYPYLPDENAPYHHVEKWYDKHTRSWVVQRMDREQNQVGSADYVGSKREAENLVRHHKNHQNYKGARD